MVFVAPDKHLRQWPEQRPSGVGYRLVDHEYPVHAPTDAEGSHADVILCLDQDPWRTLVFNYKISFQGGATADDMEPTNTYQTFAPYSNCYPFTFRVIGDDLVETGEQITVSFAQPLPDGVTLGTPSKIIFNLTDAPEPEVDTTNQPIN